MVMAMEGAMFIENPDGDVELRRAERLVRYGSVIPAIGLCVANIVGILVHAITVHQVTRSEYVSVILVSSAVGQTAVWAGLLSLRRCEGWDSGVVFYLWAGGFFTSLTVCATGTMLAALLPWVPPFVGSLARRRLRRRA